MLRVRLSFCVEFAAMDAHASRLRSKGFALVALESVYRQIGEFAADRRIGRVVLFGSRAHGTAPPKSDIDLAVSGGGDASGFADDVNEQLWSLLKIDLVNLDESSSEELAREVMRDGKALYEAL